MDNSQDSRDRPLLTIYTPYLQGFYFGELVDQLLQLCQLRNYRVSIVKTGGFGTYNSPLHAKHADMVVILRNSVSNEFAKYLLANKKPVVSIAYDYFPLPIPMITCDNEYGIELAFNHLIKSKQQKFAFIGDLSHLDIRKRYESFCDQIEINKMEVLENNTFAVKDGLLSGGYDAANEFIQSGCQATAIICGSGFTCLGFSQRLKEIDPELRENLQIVTFDAISLIPVLEKNLASIDININLIASKALSVLEEIVDGDPVDHLHVVLPKLVTVNPDLKNASDIYLATSCDLTELHDANYIKSATRNVHEWPKHIVESDLDNIMILRPLFKKLIKQISFSLVASRATGREFIKVNKIFSTEGTFASPPKDTESFVDSENYPPTYNSLNIKEFDTCIILPLHRNNTIWGVLSVYGIREDKNSPGSLTMLGNYLDRITDLLEIKHASSHNKNESKESNSLFEIEPGPRNSAFVRWETSTNSALWDSKSLHLLGFNSDLEQNIYRHMELTDRISPDNEQSLRDCLRTAETSAFSLKVKLKSRSKQYLNFQISGDGNCINNVIILELQQLEPGS